MRYAFILLGSVFTFALTTPASAYCCWNEAICEAVCNAKCCGAGLTLSQPANPAGLGNFEIQELMSEYNQAERLASRSFLRILQSETQRRERDQAAPTRLRQTN